jgi:hypothetical protein
MTRARCRGGTLGVCFLVWCLGQPAAPFERITVTRDIRGETRTERVASYEFRRAIGGFVQQPSHNS